MHEEDDIARNELLYIRQIITKIRRLWFRYESRICTIDTVIIYN